MKVAFFGFLEDFESVLDELLNMCITKVSENGGTKIYKYTPLMFGQVRNKGIFRLYSGGQSIVELSQRFHLSEECIRWIINEIQTES